MADSTADMFSGQNSSLYAFTLIERAEYCGDQFPSENYAYILYVNFPEMHESVINL